MKLVATPSAKVTHHLTNALSITPPLLTSMLTTAQLVTPDWLSALLRFGGQPKEPGSPLTTLEFEFILPAESKYRPPFDPSLPSALKKSFKPWEANEERANMLKGWRVLFIGEKGREADKELLAMLEAGGAEYEVFDVAGGERRWNQALEKNKRKAPKGLSVVADEERMRVVAGDDWDIIEEILIE